MMIETSTAPDEADLIFDNMVRAIECRLEARRLQDRAGVLLARAELLDAMNRKAVQR